LNEAAIAADAARGLSFGFTSSQNILASRQVWVYESFPWFVDHRICRFENPISNGTKVPKSLQFPYQPRPQTIAASFKRLYRKRRVRDMEVMKDL
jgi:hypothetical protein